ncbi:slr1659 superfamily regulator [Microcoleus sp. D3_18a_C4]|uniref:slr1659 superfamily regulator n=1 Tax=unclassified Microcoleus TaxID=2642155 RepID=UPI002FD59C3F
MEINTEDYQICYDPATATVSLIGSLRLSGPAEYAPIAQLLAQVADLEPTKITLNLQQLEFLNSSGINMLSKFIIEIRKTARVQMAVQGSQSIAWQGKSLRNFQRLMPGLELEFL